MRNSIKNNNGVSNILGYTFSLAIASALMFSSILITSQIIDEKKNQVAEIEAQKIANLVANAITDAVAAKISMPEAQYNKTLDLPSTIGSKSYYIEVNDSIVYVGTMDNKVKVSCSTFSADDSGIGVVDTRIYGTMQIQISSNAKNEVLNLDFGKGNSFSHSPVKAGYYRIDALGYSEDDEYQWQHFDSPYRIPIVVKNPTNHVIEDAMVKITFNDSNFNYDDATVIPYYTEEELERMNLGLLEELPPSRHETDMYLYEAVEPASQPVPPGLKSATVHAQDIDLLKTGYQWYYHWRHSIKEDVYTRIYSDGDPTDDLLCSADELYFVIENIDWGAYGLDKVVWNSIKLYKRSTPPLAGQDVDLVDCIRYEFVGSEWRAYFNRQELFDNLFNLDDHLPGSQDLISDEDTVNFVLMGVVLDGALDNRVQFWDVITVEFKFGDIYVHASDGDDINNDGSKDSPFKTIAHAIDVASDGETIFCYGGINSIHRPQGGEQIVIDKPITLAGYDPIVGDGSISTIINGSGIGGIEKLISVTSDGSGSRIVALKLESAGKALAPAHNGNGITLSQCSDIVISDCIITNNFGKGIHISNGYYNLIYKCIIKDNYGIYSIQGEDKDKAEDGDGVLITGQFAEDNCIMLSEISDHKGYFGYNPDAVQQDHDGICIDEGAEYNTILKCYIHDNYNDRGDGVEISNCMDDSAPTQYNEVIDCDIENNGGNSADGIKIYHENPDNWYANTFDYPRYNYIVNCTIHNPNLEKHAAGIYLHVTKNNKILDCRINKIYGVGIWTYCAHLNLIENCLIQQTYDIGSNEGDAIHMDCDSYRNTIKDCIIKNADGDGIQISDWNFLNLGWATERSMENTITRNDISECECGIYLGNTWENVISRCNIYSNNKQANSVGFYIIGSNAFGGGNEIKYCNFYDHNLDGVLIKTIVGWLANNGNLVHNCNFYCNDGAGVRVEKGTYASVPPMNTQVYYNNFLYKEPDIGAVNAWDNTGVAALNKWTDGDVNGNYWFDADGYDEEEPPNRKYDEIGNSGWWAYFIDPAEHYPESLADPNGWDDGHPYGPDPDWGPDLMDIKFTNPEIIIVDNNFQLPGWEDDYHYKDLDDLINDIASDNNKLIFGGTILIKYSISAYTIESPLIIDRPLRIIGIPDSFGNLPVIKYENDMQGTIIELDANFGAYNPVDKPSFVYDTLFIENLTLNGKNEYNGIGIDIPDTPSTVNYDRISISNCIIKNFDGTTINDGIGIRVSEDRVRITNCKLENNKVGIRLVNGDDCNIISNKFIENTEHGIIIEPGNSNNRIFHNHFLNTQENVIGNGAKDAEDLASGSNIWHNGYINNPTIADYAGGGNYWIYYHANCAEENALDIRKDDGTNEIGGDGIVDVAYTLDFINDIYPIGGGVVPGWQPEEQEEGGGSPVLYAIDYWNPDGESIILAKMSLEAGEEKYYYLYYGGGEDHIFINSICKGAVLSDDFLETDPWGALSVWNEIPISIEDPDGTLTLKKASGQPEYIISSLWSTNVDAPIPTGANPEHLYNDEFYTIEASIKLNPFYPINQVNMILLTQNAFVYTDSYLCTFHFDKIVNYPDVLNTLYLHKRTWDMGQKEILLYSKDLSDTNLLSDWIRIKSHVYITRNSYTYGGPPQTKTTDVTEITPYIYDYNSYLKKLEENSIFYRDGIQNGIDWIGLTPAGPLNDGYNPWFGGRIGIGCGLLTDMANPVIMDGEVKIDWIRVMKTPLVQPLITIGSTETIKYSWEQTNAFSYNDQIDLSPFIPGPQLCDFHFGTTEGIFKISQLDAGIYTITIQRGREQGFIGEIGLEIYDGYAGDPYLVSRLGATYMPQVYLSESFTFKKISDSSFPLYIKFTSDDDDGGSINPDDDDWVVNSIIVENDEKGIRLI